MWRHNRIAWSHLEAATCAHNAAGNGGMEHGMSAPSDRRTDIWLPTNLYIKLTDELELLQWENRQHIGRRFLDPFVMCLKLSVQRTINVVSGPLIMTVSNSSQKHGEFARKRHLANSGRKLRAVHLVPTLRLPAFWILPDFGTYFLLKEELRTVSIIVIFVQIDKPTKYNT